MSEPKSPIKKSESITFAAVIAASQLFNESNSKSFRTPISLLQEICTKSLCPAPVYELLDAEGKIHQPTFVFKCILNEKTQAIGKSNTKKKAKHLAALGVLNQLRLENISTNDQLSNKLEELINSLNNLDLEENPSTILSTAIEADTTSNPVITNGNELDLSNIQVSSTENLEAIKESVSKCENPVGELIEISNKFSMRPPEFEYGDEEGPPHNRQFLCNVTFGSFKESALARTKKLAKKYAALRLLYRVKASGSFNKQSCGKVDTNGTEVNLLKTNGTKKTTSNIFNQLKLSKNMAINLLLSNDLENVSSLELLNQLALEEKFEYEIYKVPTSSNVQVFSIDVKTNPHLTYGGYGTTKEEAILKAVFFTLNHIKVMCSRGKHK